MSLIDKAFNWFDSHYLPGHLFWYEYDSFSTWRKMAFWIHNWPGFALKLGWFKVYFLDWYMGHPWYRTYIHTKHKFIEIDPFVHPKVSILPGSLEAWEKLS